MLPYALSRTHIAKLDLPGNANKWTVLSLIAAVILSACNPLAFSPETKADEILTEIGARPFESFCNLQEFKLFGETQVCATHTLQVDDVRGGVDSAMRWSVARPETDWERIDGGYFRRYSYGSRGSFSVALTADTVLITYHELPETWGEEVTRVLPPVEQQRPVPMTCRAGPCRGDE